MPLNLPILTPWICIICLKLQHEGTNLLVFNEEIIASQKNTDLLQFLYYPLFLTAAKGQYT